MSPEHCDDHSKLMGTVGRMDGKLDMLIKGQESVKEDIADLYRLYNKDHTDAAVQKTKTAPIFYVIAAAAVVIVGLIIKGVWKW